MRLYNPTERKTEARILELTPAIKLFFSYETLIAISWWGRGWRLPNEWGRTTGKHFKELGCADFKVVPRLPDVQGMSKVEYPCSDDLYWEN